ncbi:MAG: hypothetical protein QXJ05_02330 [Nitrososphaerota archaeon]
MVSETTLLSRLREIIFDSESGSSEIAIGVLKLLSKEAEPTTYQHEVKLLETMINIALERPSLILPVNLLTTIRDALQIAPRSKARLKDLTERLLEIYSESLSNAVSKAVERIRGMRRIFTLSYSSQVFRVLLSLKDVSVIVNAGWPLFDGLLMAKRLRSIGINVNVYPDAALAEAVEVSDVVLIGCDAVLRDGSLVNRSGTFLASKVAEGKKPVISIVDVFKLDHIGAWRPEFTTYLQGDFELRYRLFEATPPALISEYVSEIGALKPLTFVHEAEKRIKEIVKRLAE